MSARVARVLVVACLLAAVMPVAPAYAVDPPVAQVSRLVATDGVATDVFGVYSAISGDTLVVGADHNTVGGFARAGAAYVFKRSPAGVWSLQQKITPSDPAVDKSFGHSVDIVGDTIVVGADRDGGKGTDAGAAYVFTRTAGIWTQRAKLMASDGAAEDSFGTSVAISGGTIVVGAYLEDDKGMSAGSAYVFTGSGDAWTQQPKLTASDGAAFDYFGSSVDVDGGTIVVGAYGNDGVGADVGSAYVFTRSGTSWTQQKILTASDGHASDQFGWPVAVSGGTIVTGAWADDDKAPGAGSAYVYTGSGATWALQQKLYALDGAADDAFGNAVDVRGDIVAVGALGTDGAGSKSGSTYVYARNAGVWSQLPKATASDAAAGDVFGATVALSDDSLVVCADGDTTGVGAGVGSVYVFSIKVPTAISIKTSATTSKIGGIPILSGLVTPSGLVGKNIVVYVKKAGKSYWTYSSNRTVYDRYGVPSWQYKYYFKRGMTKGLYTYKAFVPAWPGYQASTSPTTVSVRVK
jgi:hypothetical protein